MLYQSVNVDNDDNKHKSDELNPDYSALSLMMIRQKGYINY